MVCTSMKIFFWYNHLKILLNTSNYLNRVWISIRFFINENVYCEFLVSKEIIEMMKAFDITLSDNDSLDFIINNKREAFTKIYKTGHV